MRRARRSRRSDRPIITASGLLGFCRTLVVAREASEAAILDAVHSHRTMVYGRDGQAYGDAALIPLAAGDRRLLEFAQSRWRTGALGLAQPYAGLLGLGGLVASDRRHKTGRLVL